LAQGDERMTVSSELRFAISDLYAAYAACLDGGSYDDWPEFFTDDCWYRIVARENFDRDLPLSILSLKGKPMLKDRIYGITSTIFHAPYYQRHIISQPLLRVSADGEIAAQTNYAVIRTKRDMTAEVYNIGYYADTIIECDGSLKFQSKFCVFDNDLILNSLIYPI
jgi:salicylate 5-hydroxylase small subunit